MHGQADKRIIPSRPKRRTANLCVRIADFWGKQQFATRRSREEIESIGCRDRSMNFEANAKVGFRWCGVSMPLASTAAVSLVVVRKNCFECRQHFTHGEGFASGKVCRNGGQSCGGDPTPPVGGVKSPHRQPNPLLCRSFQGGGRGLSAPAQLGRAGKKEARNRRSRFGSGADWDSTDQ
jgi:hypothetical protein